jgi:hypothetical protein
MHIAIQADGLPGLSWHQTRFELIHLIAGGVECAHHARAMGLDERQSNIKKHGTDP